MSYPTISALPTAPSRARPSTFASEADAFLGALATFRTETNTAGTYVETTAATVASSVTTASEWAQKAEDSPVTGSSYSALHHAAKSAASATAAATSATAASTSATAAANSAGSVGSGAWASGTSYSVGTVVYSPITYLSYRAKTNHSGSTDPSADETNWVVLGGGGGGGLTSQTATTTATSQTAIATYAKASYTAMDLTVVADDDTNRTIVKLLIVHNGTTASATQYGEVNTSTALATYDVDISGANVRLLATPASSSSTEFTVKENLFEPLT